MRINKFIVAIGKQKDQLSNKPVGAKVKDVCGGEKKWERRTDPVQWVRLFLFFMVQPVAAGWFGFILS